MNFIHKIIKGICKMQHAFRHKSYEVKSNYLQMDDLHAISHVHLQKYSTCNTYFQQKNMFTHRSVHFAFLKI